MGCFHSGEKTKEICFSREPIPKGSVMDARLLRTRHLSAESAHNVSGQRQEGLWRKHHVTPAVTQGVSIKLEQRTPPPH